MPGFRLIPREERFYGDFIAMADRIRVGAGLLQSMVATQPPLSEKAAEIKEVEHHCDFLTHEIIQRLNRTFVTPIDREDIHEMALVLDDVMDSIDAAAALFPLYRIEQVRYGAAELADVIVRQTEEIVKATQLLEKRKGVLERSQELNRLEHEADEIHKAAVGRLFDEEKDPIVVMKWKEILDLLEDATDRCEDVANLVETIVVKHG